MGLPQVMGPLVGASDWTFIDLGCGQGMMLQPMRDALIEGKPLFRRVVGVELDPGTHREAVRAHSDPAIEVPTQWAQKHWTCLLQFRC